MHTTGCGTFVTIMVAVALITLVGLKMIEFLGETDPIQYFAETA